LVVVWNHGAGFRTVRRDIAFDDSSLGASMDMNEIESALRYAGVTPQNRIQVLGFDACLMNMIEVVHHLRGLVDVVVGSEQTEPGDGWPYDRVLAAMPTAKTPAELGKRIVRAYIAANDEVGESNVTQSAIAVDATEAAVKALADLGTVLAARLGALRGTLMQVRVQVRSYEFADYVDLIDLASRIGAATADPTLGAAAQKVVSTARKCVLANGSLGNGVAGSNGLSVWFPSELSTYLGFRSKYAALHCSERHPGWMEFLDAFHSRAAGTGVSSHVRSGTQEDGGSAGEPRGVRHRRPASGNYRARSSNR
jgi:hypothetical protein